MDELESYSAHIFEMGCMDQRVYLKSEVDAVIAEKDAEIAELEMKEARVQLVLRLNKPEALYSDLEIMSRLRHKIDVVERRELHQKYKRCLAMANYWGLLVACTHREIQLKCMRRELKWHKLAEQFKGAK